MQGKKVSLRQGKENTMSCKTKYEGRGDTIIHPIDDTQTERRGGQEGVCQNGQRKFARRTDMRETKLHGRRRAECSCRFALRWEMTKRWDQRPAKLK